MNSKNILQEIRDNLDLVIAKNSTFGEALWQELLKIHPADLAEFLTDIDRESFGRLFLALPQQLRLSVFHELSDTMKAYSLSLMSDDEKIDAFSVLAVDELTDLLDLFSDEDLKKYLGLLHKTERDKVISLLQFHPESAGGIMDTEVMTLVDDFTVEKSVKILQRLQPKREVHQQIYVINNAGRLLGHINLEDLVLHPPKTNVVTFMKSNELVVQADEDRESVAKKMVHYGLMIVPVISKDHYFLGVIPSETLADIIVEEAGEDVLKMAAMAPMKYPYFETSFGRLLYERSYILITLLLAGSISTTILKSYSGLLETGLLLYFSSMLISTGGNTSSQTSALVIQGLATGDIHTANIMRFLRRELTMATLLAVILGTVSFIRVYLTGASHMENIAISTSLALIVLVSVVLGSCIPLVLKRLNLDPAFSAGPFLATLMDIFGVLIYCYISKLILL